MTTLETLNMIKDSFESWYNKTIASDSPVTISIDYSDLQTLAIKAYHTITMELKATGIKDGLSYSNFLIRLQENYNHGVTTEEEAKLGLAQKMLTEMYNYMR